MRNWFQSSVVKAGMTYIHYGSEWILCHAPKKLESGKKVGMTSKSYMILKSREIWLTLELAIHKL